MITQTESRACDLVAIPETVIYLSFGSCDEKTQLFLDDLYRNSYDSCALELTVADLHGICLYHSATLRALIAENVPDCYYPTSREYVKLVILSNTGHACIRVNVKWLEQAVAK